MESSANAAAATDTAAPLTGVKRLLPAGTRVFQGAFGLLHCSVGDDPTVYRGVWAVLLFPITHPGGYVSLRYTGADDKEHEIGVIERLADFPADAQALVRFTLVKQYHERVVRRIHGVTCRFGLLFFDIETDRGREAFVMPWRYDRAEDFGDNGKVLLDSLDNRYIIPDVGDLPPADRRAFLGFIYW